LLTPQGRVGGARHTPLKAVRSRVDSPRAVAGAPPPAPRARPALSLRGLSSPLTPLIRLVCAQHISKAAKQSPLTQRFSFA
jgi:hypothetical protein